MMLPFKTNVLRKVLRWTSDGDSGTDTGLSDKPGDTEVTEDLNDADLITSQQHAITYPWDLDPDGSTDPEHYHTPVLDIDVPAMLVPSSTPGRHHLYIDTPMPWSLYVKLLDVMAECGILEPGYVGASKARGFTAVRLPWVRKNMVAEIIQAKNELRKQLMDDGIGNFPPIPPDMEQ